MHLVDPTYEERPQGRRLAERPLTLAGATVGIVSNGKAGTRPFFDHLERLLREEWRVGEVVRLTKGNYSAPAEAAVMAEAATWAALFAGIGD